MAHRAEFEDDETGETYWVDVSNKAREMAINRAISNGTSPQDELIDLFTADALESFDS